MSRSIMALALLLLPLSYGTKFLIGMPELVWVNPSLILGFVLLLLVSPSVRPRSTLALVFMAVVSACVGFFELQPSGLYDVFREPLRLGLNVIFFWVSLRWWQTDRRFVLRWLTVSVVLQLIIAIYLALGALGLAPLPDAVSSYVTSYALRQSVMVGNTLFPRLAGTFMESPPFGLFMFCSFTIFTMELAGQPDRPRWLWLGWLLALVGAIGALADQVLLGLVVLGLASVASTKNTRSRTVVTLVSIVLLVSTAPYVLDHLALKTSQIGLTDTEVYATSGGERAFHARYALELFSQRWESLLVGIGPGRYGEYVSRTGFFPASVTTQVTFITWLTEYGVIGFMIVVGWLTRTAKLAVRAYGFLGLGAFLGLLVANMFQANWKWEAWFLAVAHLYAESSRRLG